MALFLTTVLCSSLAQGGPSRVRPAFRALTIAAPLGSRVAARAAGGRRGFTRDLLAATTLGAAGCIQNQNFAADAAEAQLEVRREEYISNVFFVYHFVLAPPPTVVSEPACVSR